MLDRVAVPSLRERALAEPGAYALALVADIETRLRGWAPGHALESRVRRRRQADPDAPGWHGVREALDTLQIAGLVIESTASGAGANMDGRAIFRTTEAGRQALAELAEAAAP